ncbi:MAG: DUF4093 domain-containing protein [Oscillospiraceae bacterium]|nr:DUF4093 domain-containing protein [Oscillospiraceae bacterium]
MKIPIKQVILVEGKYDKIRLSSIFDGLILDVGGFRLFNDSELLGLIRRLAQTRGAIVFTDSDRAGFQLRGFLSGAIPKEQLTHVYLPDIYGKEKRKPTPSAEGKIGVEGADRETILKAFQAAGLLEESGLRIQDKGHENTTFTSQREQSETSPLTPAYLFEIGLVGRPNSKGRRQELLRQLGLPERLSTKALVGVLEGLREGMSEIKL